MYNDFITKSLILAEYTFFSHHMKILGVCWCVITKLKKCNYDTQYQKLRLTHIIAY